MKKRPKNSKLNRNSTVTTITLTRLIFFLKIFAAGKPNHKTGGYTKFEILVLITGGVNFIEQNWLRLRRSKSSV